MRLYPLLLAFLALSPAACRRERPPGPALGALLEVALESGSLRAEDAALARAEIARLAEPVAAALRRGERPAEVLRRALFEQGGFRREIDSLEARFMLLPGVLRERRGTCVGLGSLYLALAEAAGVAAHGVLVPGHFFVRVDGGTGGALANVELLRQGEPMPDGWYRTRYGVPRAAGDAAAGAPGALEPGDLEPYLRPLSMAEVTAVLRFNVANELRERGRPQEALARYRRAAADFPTFAEAHASVGLVQHMLGRLDEARQAYRTARQLQPQLPGLERNLAVLESEMKRRKKL
jgi:tetratricopeptide (TPR) repeat protein